jgi:chromosome partitioning protein
MKIITVANQKGGVGKSTLTLNLAYVYAKEVKTAIIDADIQGSLSELLPQENAPIEVLPIPPNWKSLQELEYDVLLIDTPPYLSKELPLICSFSDLVLIPTKAGFFDALAIKATITVIREAMRSNSSLKAGVLLNMVKQNTTLTSEIKDILKETDLPLLESSLTDRVSYTRSLLTGGVLQGTDYKAKLEITSLADEVLSMMGI